MFAFLTGCENPEGIGIEISPDATVEEVDVNTSRQRPYFGGSRNQRKQCIIKFFYIVNETGENIKVKVLGDERVIVVQEVGFERDLSSGVIAPPPTGKFPGRELKVAINRDTKIIEIQELNSGKTKKFDLKNVSKINGGFRITVREDEILLNLDYFPIR